MYINKFYFVVYMQFTYLHVCVDINILVFIGLCISIVFSLLPSKRVSLL